MSSWVLGSVLLACKGPPPPCGADCGADPTDAPPLDTGPVVVTPPEPTGDTGAAHSSVPTGATIATVVEVAVPDGHTTDARVVGDHLVACGYGFVGDRGVQSVLSVSLSDPADGWAETAETHGRCDAVVPNPEGGFLTYGSGYASGLEGEPTPTLTRHDDDLEALELRPLGGTDALGPASAIAPVVDGGFYLGTEQRHGLSNNTHDVQVVRLEPDLGRRWANVYGGLGTERTSALVGLRDGGVMVVATTDGFGVPERALWLLRLDWGGNVAWQEAVGLGAAVGATDPTTARLGRDLQSVLVVTTLDPGADPSLVALRVGIGGRLEASTRLPGFAGGVAIDTADGGVRLAGLYAGAPALIGLGADLSPSFATAYGVAGVDPAERVTDLVERRDGDLVLAGFRRSGAAFAVIVRADGATDCRGGGFEPRALGYATGPLTPDIAPTDGETFPGAGQPWPGYRPTDATVSADVTLECPS